MKFQRFLKLIREGEPIENLPPFCIIKDREKNLIDKSCKTVWKLFRAPKVSEMVILNRREADLIIERAGLIPTLEDHGSVLYDTPDRNYATRYKYYCINGEF